ncbi:hypothetical protein DFH05DRAFT_1460453 [Lentinula detonsa]|uniref:Uncharacterized protein n=1 Tax=Lentinula detonsa TaxID=2804962 RepID=A0A9W8P0E9_9AGAR|nr:hypothetical protein DFH05DRAFT_1460453 [Lentinula detonsa]
MCKRRFMIDVIEWHKQRSVSKDVQEKIRVESELDSEDVENLSDIPLLIQTSHWLVKAKGSGCPEMEKDGYGDRNPKVLQYKVLPRCWLTQKLKRTVKSIVWNPIGKMLGKSKNEEELKKKQHKMSLEEVFQYARLKSEGNASEKQDPIGIRIGALIGSVSLQTIGRSPDGQNQKTCRKGKRMGARLRGSVGVSEAWELWLAARSFGSVMGLQRSY